MLFRSDEALGVGADRRRFCLHLRPDPCEPRGRHCARGDVYKRQVYVFDDRVVLNFNFTDDSKTISREEVLGSSAVDNAPPNVRPFT